MDDHKQRAEMWSWANRASGHGGQPERRAVPIDDVPCALGRCGRREVIALLEDVAAEPAQLCQLGAFSTPSATTRRSSVRARLTIIDDDRLVLAVAAEAGDERAVDLEHLDREPAQVRQRRVPRAEVVDREVDAERADRVEGVAAPPRRRP